MDRSLVRNYFGENSKAWLASAYESDGYGFPTALARVRRTVSILVEKLPLGNADIVDLGCGAGQLCLELGEMGYRVTGVDESEEMLSEALKALASMPGEIQSQVRFVKKDVLDNGLEGGSCDAVTALGVIGYLPNDDVLFEEAARLLRPNGLFIVSCRNRLFNMVSITQYTVREIEQGGAKELIQEIRELYQQIPEQDAMNFVKSLARVSGELVSESPKNQGSLSGPGFPPSIEARQHRPKRLLETARIHGFKHEGFYGVNPHLLMASLNRLLPPNVFNDLSTSLEALAHLPVSLIWSSVFIGTFRKQVSE